MRNFRKLSLLLAGIMVPGVVSSGTATTAMDVSTNVVAACLVSATNIDFGTTDGTDVVNTTGTITVNCSSGASYNVALDAGLHSLNGGYRGVQNAAGDIIVYSLWKDAGYTDQWGDSDFANTYPLGSSVAGTGTGVAQQLTVEAVLDSTSGSPGNVFTPDTIYSDTVTVTVHF